MLEEDKVGSPSLLGGPPELNRQERDAQNIIYSETEEEKINIRSSRNGSTLYLYPVIWQVQTSNQPEGRKMMNSSKTKFAVS
jgi:hypothetical protein